MAVVHKLEERNRNIDATNRLWEPWVGGVDVQSCNVGFNPRYRMWTRENWHGYAPTIGDMERRGWSLTLHCDRCKFATKADIDKIIRQRGRTYSPWGKSARCPALHGGGRMTLRAYAPGPNEFIDI